MELLEELNRLIKQLQIEVNQLEKTGTNYAKAYSEYRIALAKELTTQRANNIPVTLCGDLARGKTEVAEKKFREISTEAIYKANLESINAIKLHIKVLENQIGREFNNG